MRASKPRIPHYRKYSGYLNSSWKFDVGSNWLDSALVDDCSRGYAHKTVLVEGATRVTIRRYLKFNFMALAVTEHGTTRYSVVTSKMLSAVNENYKIHRLGCNTVAVITFELIVDRQTRTMIGYIDVSDSKPCIVGLCLLPVSISNVQLKKARSNPELLTFLVSGLSGRREQLKVHIPKGQRPRIINAPPGFPSVQLSPRECGIKSI